MSLLQERAHLEFSIVLGEKKKIFSDIRLKYNWHKRFLPNARNVKSCPAVTQGVIIVELSLFRIANEKEKRKDNIKITFVLTRESLDDISPEFLE